jgi:hypothetical protein
MDWIPLSSADTNQTKMLGPEQIRQQQQEQEQQQQQQQGAHFDMDRFHLLALLARHPEALLERDAEGRVSTTRSGARSHARTLRSSSGIARNWSGSSTATAICPCTWRPRSAPAHPRPSSLSGSTRGRSASGTSGGTCRSTWPRPRTLRRVRRDGPRQGPRRQFSGTSSKSSAGRPAKRTATGSSPCTWPWEAPTTTPCLSSTSSFSWTSGRSPNPRGAAPAALRRHGQLLSPHRRPSVGRGPRREVSGGGRVCGTARDGCRCTGCERTSTACSRGPTGPCRKA